MYLLLWGFLLSLFSSFINSLVSFLVGLSCSIPQYEIDIRKQIRDLKAELSQISMMDEFPTYAKKERKINKLKEELVKCNSLRLSEESRARFAFTITFHAIVGLATILTAWSNWGEPVTILPAGYTYPIGWLLRTPGVSVDGGISLPIWMGICRSCIGLLPSFTSLLPHKEYSQLPLD